MKRMGLVGMVVAVVFGVGAVFAVAASAAPPEFLKKTKFTLEGLTAVFKTVGGGEMRCAASKGEGEVAVEKSKVAKGVKIKFTGCKLKTFVCETVGAAEGEVLTKSLEGELGYIKPGKAGAEHVAFALLPTVGEVFAEYECAASVIKVKDKGSCIIGELAKAGVETNVFSLVFEETAGVQKLKELEKTLGGAERKCTMTEEVSGGGTEGVGLETSLTMKTMELEKIMS
jgi:hypothetical protein